MGAWSFQGRIASIIEVPPEAPGEEPTCPIWEHQEITIEMPGKSNEATPPGEAVYHLYFDGACRRKMTAGGYVLYHKQKVVDGRFEYYGQSPTTNNKAEVLALHNAVKWAAELVQMKNGQIMNVIGDSKLIIDFLNRKSQPGDKFFVSHIQSIKEITRKIPGRIMFVHVPRDSNTHADFLS